MNTSGPNQSSKEEHKCSLGISLSDIARFYAEYSAAGTMHGPPVFWDHLQSCAFCQERWEAQQRQSRPMTTEIEDLIDIGEAAKWAADEAARRRFAESLVKRTKAEPSVGPVRPGKDKTIELLIRTVTIAQANTLLNQLARETNLPDAKHQDVIRIVAERLDPGGVNKVLRDTLREQSPALATQQGQIDLSLVERAVQELRNSDAVRQKSSHVDKDDFEALLFFAVLEYAEKLDLSAHVTFAPHGETGFTISFRTGLRATDGREETLNGRRR